MTGKVDRFTLFSNRNCFIQCTGWNLITQNAFMISEYLKVCLHVPTLSPSPSQCPTKFNIVSMVDGQNGSVTHSASQAARYH